MANGYSIVLLLTELAAGCCYFLAGRKKSEYTRALQRLYLAGMGTVLVYILFLQTSGSSFAAFLAGLRFIGVDVILLMMMEFILMYTDTQIHTKLFRYFFLVCVVLDAMLLLLNNYTGSMFTVESAAYRGVRWSMDYQPLYYYHLVLGYFMALFIMAVLMNKISKSPRLYRKMYAYVLAAFGGVAVISMVCFVTRMPIDVSLMFYMLLAVFFCYFLLYVSPKGLVESILANVVEGIDKGIVCFDLRGKCIYANTMARQLLEVKDGLGGPIVDDFYANWIQKNPQDSMDDESWDKEYFVEGEEHHFHVEFQRLKDFHNSTVGYFYKLTDETAEMKTFQEGQYLATHDRLTGLYNKEYFFQKAEEIIRRNPQKERYMVCADIRNFKLMNDLFGEEMGDKILVAQAALLKYTNYEDCIQGRISGEKFAMLVTKENFNSEMMVKNTGRLQYMIDGRNYKLNIAMGVYNITDPDESPEEMYEKASMAAQSQDNDYQKTVVYYDSKMLQQILQEKSMTDEFENAIRTKQFRMFLQPQMDEQGKLLGAEALARWQHPQRGLVFPVDFISVVEKTGLISRLDEYMWELAAEKLREWKDKGILDLSISVNISVKDFYYIDVYEVFVGLIGKYGISPANLNLEISEMELLSDADSQIHDLNRLQEYGFRLQIDDFGEGYSSLNMLQNIRANSLKIDMRLFGEAGTSSKGKRILNAIITMAEALDMDVLTESVETEEQVRLLQSLGCNAFQGYYFSRPIPVEEFEEKYLKVV